MDQAKTEGILAGRLEGQDNERLSSIRNVMKNLGVSIQRQWKYWVFLLRSRKSTYP